MRNFEKKKRQLCFIHKKKFQVLSYPTKTHLVTETRAREAHTHTHTHTHTLITTHVFSNR